MRSLECIAAEWNTTPAPPSLIPLSARIGILATQLTGSLIGKEDLWLYSNRKCDALAGCSLEERLRRHGCTCEMQVVLNAAVDVGYFGGRGTDGWALLTVFERRGRMGIVPLPCDGTLFLVEFFVQTARR